MRVEDFQSVTQDPSRVESFKVQFQQIDRLRDKMLRRIVDWRRLEGKDARDTTRLSQRLSQAK